MIKIFLSYAKENANIALEIHSWLSGHGLDVWMDIKNLVPGQKWEAEIVQAIQTSDIFIACLSTNSVDKVGYVQAELRRALEVADLMPEGRIYLIPIRLDECEVPFKLRDFQWLNYFEADGKEKLLSAVQGRVNTIEMLEKELTKFLLNNGAELLKEKFGGIEKAEITRALLSIASREDELLSVRSRAVQGLSILGALNDSAWSEIIPTASTDLFQEWISAWGADDDRTVLTSTHVRLMLESKRLPKSSTGFGKAVRKFIKRGAGYTSAVFLPGQKYPAWTVKYDCVRSIITLDDSDSMRTLAAFSTMSYWQARKHIIEYIAKKQGDGELTPQETQTAIAILNQIITDGKTEEKTLTMRKAREVLAKLTQDQTPGKATQRDNVPLEREKFFDAGERIKRVRSELGLKTSQIMELIGFPSQREYEAIENREKEAPLSLLKTVSELSGVSLEWLKHEEGTRYEVEAVYFRPIEKDLEFCTSLKPKEYFLTLNKNSLHVGLVAQTDEFRYQVIETGVTLDFWNWVESHWAIPAFYHFLDELSGPWHDIDGVILPKNIDEKLFKGEIHFLTALANAERYGRDLLYDLLDVNESRTRRTSYSVKYGGNWMPKVHDTFQEYLQAQ